jgi:hypothetical protein
MLQTKKTKFKKTKIRVNLLEEPEYNNGLIKIHVIKFVEVDENEENVNV